MGEGKDVAVMVPVEDQIAELADFIMEHVPGEPSESEGACATAVRVMRRYLVGILAALHELGVPGDGYPAPVANAVALLEEALDPNARQRRGS